MWLDGLSWQGVTEKSPSVEFMEDWTAAKTTTNGPRMKVSIILVDQDEQNL